MRMMSSILVVVIGLRVYSCAVSQKVIAPLTRRAIAPMYRLTVTKISSISLFFFCKDILRMRQDAAQVKLILRKAVYNACTTELF